MKTLQSKLIVVLGVMLLLAFTASQSFAFLEGKEAHEKYIYPIVRVSTGEAGGSGTIIYSGRDKEEGPFSTYVLTNHHVIASAIRITDVWDSNLKKEIKEEKRSIVYVEVFKYRDLSTPVGTLKVEADIILYNENEDMALIKLRSEDKAEYIAHITNPEEAAMVKLMDKTIAVGCSLGFPPIPTPGVLTRKDFQVDSLPYHMSSSQIIYGNSGGAIFEVSGNLIGIPSLVPVVGWGTPVTHMGLFIPISRVYTWLEKEHYDFLWDSSKTEVQCLKAREEEIDKKNAEK